MQELRNYLLPEKSLEVVREQKAVTLLRKWPWKTGGTLIGGYAIAAYGPPRYSEDLDIVISRTALNPILRFLDEQGFLLRKDSYPNSQNLDGEVMTFDHEEVSVDLLVGYIRDRDAKVDIPESWVSQRSNTRILRIKTGETTAIPIARPEAIWALKLQAGRSQDITDLFAIYDTRFESKEIIELFRGLMNDLLKTKLLATLQKSESDKLFEDSMSRLEMKQTEKNRERWTRFGSAVRRIVESSILV
jgi:hypothetical protein